MIEQQAKTFFRAFLVNNPMSLSIINLIPEGIPVFYVKKVNNEILDRTYYSWSVEFSQLSSIQLSKLLEFFSKVNDVTKQTLLKEGLDIPEPSIDCVLSPDGKTVDTRYTYLSQLVDRQIVKNKSVIHMSMSMISLHFICLACIRLFTSQEFKGYGDDILSHQIPNFIHALSSGDEEIREFYQLFLNNSSFVEDSKDS